MELGGARSGLLWLSLALAAGLALAMPASATTGFGISRTVLNGTEASPRAGGTAIFLVYRKAKPEISLRARGLVRPRDPFYLAWVIDGSGDAYIGGGFGRSRRSSFAGSLVVPGPYRASIERLRSCKKLLITKVADTVARRVIRRARDERFDRPVEIVGQPLMSGKPERLADFPG